MSIHSPLCGPDAITLKKKTGKLFLKGLKDHSEQSKSLG